jgi:hypothetical protein
VEEEAAVAVVRGIMLYGKRRAYMLYIIANSSIKDQYISKIAMRYGRQNADAIKKTKRNECVMGVFSIPRFKNNQSQRAATARITVSNIATEYK